MHNFWLKKYFSNFLSTHPSLYNAGMNHYKYNKYFFFNEKR